jgi:hypothetical protein
VSLVRASLVASERSTNQTTTGAARARPRAT